MKAVSGLNQKNSILANKMQYVEMGYLHSAPIKHYDSQIEKILTELKRPINFLKLVEKLGEDTQEILWIMYDRGLIRIDEKFNVSIK